MGTTLCFNGATRSFQPKRSSSQSRTITSALISALPLSRNHDLFAADVYAVLLKRAGRRAGDITSGEVVNAVVAGTPDLLHVAAVLHGAAQVSAGGRHGFVLTVRTHDEGSGAAAEFEDL